MSKSAVPQTHQESNHLITHHRNLDNLKKFEFALDVMRSGLKWYRQEGRALQEQFETNKLTPGGLAQSLKRFAAHLELDK